MENNDTEIEIEEKSSFSTKIKKYFKNLFDFSKFDKKTILYIVLFIVLIGISLYLIYILFFVDNTFLYRLVIEWFVNPIYNLQILGIFLFLAVMAIQGLLIPIPSEIVLLATGMIWGWFVGGIMGIFGSMAAGLLCFYISKKGGRPLAEKFIGESALNMADDFIKKYGLGAIIVARFLPFVAFDPISYASGLVDMDVKKYTLATFIGSIPRAFFYSILGSTLGIVPPIQFDQIPLEQIEAQAAFFNTVLTIIVVVLFAMFLAYYIISKYWESRRENSEN